MTQEPENTFMTTTSCLPAYIQLHKWHLIALCVAMVTFLSHILMCPHTHNTHMELEGSQATSVNGTQTLNQGTSPGSGSWAAPRSQAWGIGNSPHAHWGRAGLPASCTALPRLNPPQPSRDLLESSFVVVDRLNVTALVFQKIGIVVVHLGVVRQGLHSWAAKRNRNRIVLADQLLHLPQGPPSSHSPFFWKVPQILGTLSPPAHLYQHNSLQPQAFPMHWYTTCPTRTWIYAAAIQLVLASATTGTSRTNTATLPVARCCHI